MTDVLHLWVEEVSDMELISAFDAVSKIQRLLN